MTVAVAQARVLMEQRGQLGDDRLAWAERRLQELQEQVQQQKPASRQSVRQQSREATPPCEAKSPSPGGLAKSESAPTLGVTASRGRLSPPGPGMGPPRHRVRL